MVENAVMTAYCLNPKTLPRCMPLGVTGHKSAGEAMTEHG